MNKQKLERCPCCGKPAKVIVTAQRGIPSGDMGAQAKISCFDRECDCSVVRWALKAEWAVESAAKAWNRRAPLPDNCVNQECPHQRGEPCHAADGCPGFEPEEGA